LAELDALLRAVAHPIRREILWLTWDRAVQAGEIAARFAVAAPTVSQHLRILRDAGLVSVERSGTTRRYRARTDRLAALAPLLAPHNRTDKWDPGRVPQATGQGDQVEATARVGNILTFVIHVATPADEAFTYWTDPDRMATWLGSDVTCDATEGGVFAVTLDEGPTLRGIFEVLARPRFIRFRWDFDHDQVPLPPTDTGPASILFTPAGRGTRVDVEQVVYGPAAPAAAFLAAAWPHSLGRLRQAIHTRRPGGKRNSG
jgi:DNA-binding transcriptional ArsR family regulator/uncharacterized protein YndB with AHSA1/START domain